MAIVYEDQCCSCATPNYPCRGARCPNRRVEVHVCDRCGEPLERLEINNHNGHEYCGLCRDELFN